MTNPHDQLNDYLEFLAGRRKRAPELSSEDRDLLRAMNLLRHAKPAQPVRPEFLQQLRERVSSQGQPAVPSKAPVTQPSRSSSFVSLPWWFVRVAPVVAMAVVLVAIIQLPAGTPGPDLAALRRSVVHEADAAVITFQPTDDSLAGVAASSSFMLAAKDGSLTLPDVQDKLVFNPKLEVTITKEANNRFKVTPKNPLVPNTVYTASYDGFAKDNSGQTIPRRYSWAFQVRREFAVIGTYPRHTATGVALSTGIDVTFSSPGVTASAFKSHITVLPSTTFTTEVHGRTLSIVPTQPLKERTVYTITVKGDLKPEGGALTLGQDVVFRFETGQQNTTNYFMPVGPRYVFETAIPDQPIYFSDSFAVYDQGTGKQEFKTTYEFTVYQYPSLASFKTAMEERQANVVPWSTYGNVSPTSVQGLTKVATVKTQIRDGVMVLPKAFPAGAYLAETVVNGTRTQFPYLITSIGSYDLTTSTDTVVWLNDLSTHGPIDGAEVVLPDGTVVRTGADGVARFPTPAALKDESTAGLILTVRAGTATTLVILNGANPYRRLYGRMAGTASDGYWSYLTTDRTLYRPTDTIHFWGLARPRATDQTLKRVTAELVVTNWERGGAETVVSQKELTLTPDATFLGEFSLSDMPIGWGKELRILDGQTVIYSRYLDVQAFRTPPYRLTLAADRVAAFPKDPITLTVTATFFDGTPVPGVALSLNANGGYSLTTDANGQAKQTVAAPENNLYASLQPTDDQTSNMEATANVQVYPAAIALQATSRRTTTTAVVEGTVIAVDPTQADPAANDPYSGVNGAPVPGVLITGRIQHTVYKQTKTGQHYDFLSKKVVPTYTYSNEDKEAGTFTVTTDANGRFTYSIPTDPLVTLHVTLSAKDAKGRSISTELYPWMSAANFATTAYTLVDTRATETVYNPLYGVGDMATMEVRDPNGAPVTEKDFTYLYTTAQRGLRSVTISKKSTFSFRFSDDDVPNVLGGAVIFTGSGYQEISGPNFTFDQSTRKLKLTVTPNKSSYAPGETITLSMKVTDEKNRGVHARINVRGIDEAVAILQDPWVSDNPLTGIYKYVDSGVFGSYLSHQTFGRATDNAEGGGGGDRIDFKDVALYTEVVSDADGRATATFKAPDNLTSWRITTQAISSDLEAGVATLLVPVRRPVFVRTDVPRTVLTADRPKIEASVFGTALQSGDPVSLTFSIVGQNQTQQVISGKAFESAFYQLPALEPGSYQIRIAATAKGENDAVVLPIDVARSTVVRLAASMAILSEHEAPVVGTAGRTEIQIGDADRTAAYAALIELLGNPNYRLDEAVASALSSRLLRTTFKQSTPEQTFDPSAFLASPGVALYPLGSADLEYASLAAGDEGWESYRGQLEQWFRSVVDDPQRNTEQVIQAIYGLAQLNEPVLPEIRAMLSLDGITDQERLTLALALESLGAIEEARPIASYLLSQYGASETPYTWLTLGASADEQRVATARMAMLAAGLQLPERYALLRYATTHAPKDTTTHLEQALAAEYLLAYASTQPASVTYSLQGKTKTVSLSGATMVNLSLDASEAATFKIISFTGQVGVATSYEKSFDPAAVSDPKLSISRRYVVNGKPATSFKRGDIVRVEISWDAKKGAPGRSYAVIDDLPTGLRPLTSPWLFSQGWDPKLAYPVALDERRVQIYAGRKSFFYRAQAVVSGTAVAEPPILQAIDAPGSMAVGTTSQGITIK